MAKLKNPSRTKIFDEICIGLASPEDISSWSSGEVTNTETINYRTQKMERGGLFCERIFGPVMDMQCSCSKYKGMQYNGIVCDKCGVEVTDSSVRRDRMGHIELVSPIAHIWYLRKTPSRIALLLELQASQVQSVVSFANSIVTKVDEIKKKAILENIKKEFKEQYKNVTNEKTKKHLSKVFDERVAEVQSVDLKNILDDEKLYELQTRYPSFFKVETGSEPLYEMLRKLNLKSEEKRVKKELLTISKSNEQKIQKQLSLIRSLIRSSTRPEWMFLTRLPVLPPDLRPLIMLDGGRYASSDLNDLYRTVIIRNNRLRTMKEKYNAPDIILQNEKRLLQEAVDALLDNSIKTNVTSYASRTKKADKKSITEHLTQKSGQFRQNLLGKRVDFSARAVIVVGADLAFDECGIPKQIAIELFKPFIIAELIKREAVQTMRQGTRMVEDAFEYPIVWDILDDVIENKVVLLNRQPTLHKQNILAFKPVLIDTKAIQLHPLVCKGFNADFDGDAMAVYLPLSDEAQEEAKRFLMPYHNIINPGEGTINTAPNAHDIALGCFWATSIENGAKGEGKVFATLEDAEIAFENDIIDLRTHIHIMSENIETTVGRILFKKILPKDVGCAYGAIGKSELSAISEEIFKSQENKDAGEYFNTIKEFGFKYSFVSGTTISWTDYAEELFSDSDIDVHLKEVQTIQEQYEMGLLSDIEKTRKKVTIWENFYNEIEEKTKTLLPADSPLRYMIESKARGSWNDMTITSGLLGIITNAQSETIEEPILSSYRKGLTPIEFFKASFGGRKGSVDIALRTGKAGYLARRLFDALHDIVVVNSDCRTKKGIRIEKNTHAVLPDVFKKNVLGRIASEDVFGKNKQVIVARNGEINKNIVDTIEKDETITEIKIRSPLTCSEANGVCQRCYGIDTTKNILVDLGTAVGVLASTSIAEPGTQLTMRTFHTGGVGVTGGDITTGLPRVESLVDNIKPKAKTILSRIEGVVHSIEPSGQDRIITIAPSNAKKSPKRNTVYVIPKTREIIVSIGREVRKGEPLTDGQHDLEELNDLKGKEDTQRYIMDEIRQVYELQGSMLSSVHFEILVKRMYGLYEIIDAGDSEYTAGDVLEWSVFTLVQQKQKEQGKLPLKAKNIIQGIKRVALQRESFLSNASFERSTEGLIKAALTGSTDQLKGLKENVIAGKLVPVGSGFEGSREYKVIIPIVEKNKQIVQEQQQQKKNTLSS